MTEFGSLPERSLPDASGQVILQVGEQQFHTSKATLEGSEMLNAMVSDRWKSGEQSDNTFFLDADPEVFKHILRFLRHGVYPICYDMASGHDYGLYIAIYKLADFLWVPKLAGWLRDQRYLQALKTMTSARIKDDEDDLSAINDSNIKIQYHPTWRTVKRYVCPRGLSVHYDNPQACGKACRAAQGNAENEYEDCPVLSTLCVTERVLFDQNLCTYIP
ncbi:MAG: hypothetical protein LQ343_006539 [Gyalolechia ehrenbergii]|nr:MAG: hypothetical protein LQ343_006539 [Gyalolechia ehrenbergii]